MDGRRTIELEGGVRARVRPLNNGAIVDLSASTLPWQILVVGLQQRDDFRALLHTFSAQVESGIDYTGYLVRPEDVGIFLEHVNGLIVKHFPRRQVE